MRAGGGRRLTAFTLILICSKSRARFLFVVFAGVLLPLAIAAPGQSGDFAASASQQTPIQSVSALVIVEASVADGHGNFLGGLERSQFHVFDDGVEQPLAVFQTIQEPQEVCVLVETSPAVYLIQRQHLEAAYALLDGLPADAQVALATYDTATRVVMPFTTNRGALLGTLNGLQYFLGMGDLNFYDAVNSTLSWIELRHSKEALLVLSTGLDSSPASHWQALRTRIESGYAPIFTVALGGELRDFKGKKSKGDAASKRKKNENDDGPFESAVPSAAPQGPPGTQPDFERATKALRAIAETSGGRAYFPASPTEFVRIYQEIALQLRNQYFLGYVPPARDGKTHGIEIRVTNAQGKVVGATGANNGLRVYARQSYLAAEN
jgi:Ca-activated chloride channel family protein